MSGPLSDLVVVYVTAPPSEAPELARALVTRRVAACASIIPAIRSIYSWQGKLADDTESLLVIKTTRDRFAALESAIIELHSYDVPEVLALPVVAGHGAYCDWVRTNVESAAP